METTIVHVCRHGQVDNPDHVLYGRLPGYGLSDLGRRMAQRLAEYFSGVELAHLVSSPLQRAQETMAPIAAAHPHLDVAIDERVIEAENVFEGVSFGRFNERLLLPQNLWQLRNPFRPSWGEPYAELVGRMRPAIVDAAAAAGPGAQALIVSHQLPIYLARRDAEGRPYLHNPAGRQCRQASVTSFQVVGAQVVGVTYTEPCADLYPTDKKLFRPGM